MKFKNIALIFSFMAFVSGPSIGQTIDPVVIKQASCLADEVLSPEIAAFRLMEMSSVMNKERFGELTIYAAAVESSAGFARVNGLVPTRFMVLTKRGLSEALIGATFTQGQGSSLSDKDLLGSFAGVLKKDFTLVEFNSASISRVKAIRAGISQVPVKGTDTYLLYVKLSSGERLVVCGPKPVLNRLLY